jgi:S1-C subfamily serine protease
MRSGRSVVSVIGGCVLVLVLAVLAVPAFLYVSERLPIARPEVPAAPEPTPVAVETQAAIPTLTAVPVTPEVEVTPAPIGQPENDAAPELVSLYQAVSRGVVNIQVFVRERGASGLGAGSGFVLDEDGHIVTNQHVVAGAHAVTIVFYNGFEAPAEIVGTDPDSDLAIVRVEALPEDVHALALGDSAEVEVGEWVIAIGNPFGLGGSMSVGIVSAVGRTIEGVTHFRIPEAIQTDAAINPGNSGGPLINLAGEVVGVNAMIATGGTRASAGVGFAIPANVVRRVAPVLIDAGVYHWPWLGVSGQSVNLLLAQANDLETQSGAYVHAVEPVSPAGRAGLQGSSGATALNGIQVPVGGDVIVAANGQTVEDFADLLVTLAYSQPGDELSLTVLRNGEQHEMVAVLEPRPRAQP